MTVTLYFDNGKSIDLGRPRTLKILQSYDTPAHNMIATFPYEYPLPNAVRAKVYYKGKEIFDGNVDEQIISVSKSGYILTIDARTSSELLDNEAYPTTYHNPSLHEIYRVHAKPYGIKGVVGNGILNGDFTVTKGTSEWEVISEFCKTLFNVQPQITYDGYLYAEKKSLGSEKVIFSNTLNNAHHFYEAKIENKRYGVISQIVYKPETKSTYKSGLQNPYLNDKSINIRRLVNLSGLQSYERNTKIEKTFKKSMLDSFKITLKTDICIEGEIGGKALFRDEKLGSFENLIIYEKQLVISQNGTYCQLKLIPEKNI